MPNVEKQVMMRELLKKIENKPYIFFAQFTKLSTGDMSALRKNIQKSSDGCVVLKNTLAKKILDQIGVNGSTATLIEGQTLVATCQDEPQKLSKIFVDFAKEKEDAFKIKGAVVEGKAFEKVFVTELAKLPGKKELLTKVAIGVKSPITGFVLTLNAVLRSFVVVVNEVAKKKGEVSQGEPQQATA